MYKISRREQCTKCKYRTGTMKCKAFPDRIPMLIYGGSKKHDRIIKGQIGDYIYEPKEKFIEIDRLQLEEDRKVLALYRQCKEQLPRLVIKALNNLGYEMDVIQKILFRFSASTGSIYSNYLQIHFKNGDIEEKLNAISQIGDSIYHEALVISKAEKIIRGMFYFGNYLRIDTNGDYEYLRTIPKIKNAFPNISLEQITFIFDKVIRQMKQTEFIELCEQRWQEIESLSTPDNIYELEKDFSEVWESFNEILAKNNTGARRGASSGV